jgi:carnitine 3-dehydrogenase
MGSIGTFWIAGAGVIGAGWAVRAVVAGFDVTVRNPDQNTGDRFREIVKSDWSVMEEIGLHHDASLDRLRINDSIEEMAAAADFIQESAPERLELKTELHDRI